ncbi:LacI family DNA-binding transcriptional regulator [Streptosporangium roseum]|uniref:LacI family DNA-binding transcriptional regulator n=1 Tax=Streptosporangium roseum TaxID=2001 RepID=UPI0009DD9A02|nr:LacI family DNA-binding transcriptional regulator [Streptosporangium roseum]
MTSHVKPPTSVDVARAAGVSQATVSYVLNDSPGARVGDETRERVKEAAARLGYVPHASARALRTGHSGLVLLPLSLARTGRLAQDLLDEMGDELRERGYTLIQYGERRLKGAAAARSWAELRPVAVLVEVDRLSKAAVDLLKASGVKAVIGFGAERPSPLVPVSLYDQEAIGACAAEHLVSRGRTRLAAVVPREQGIDKMGAGRWRGVCRVAPGAERIELTFSEDEAARFAARSDLPDGVFAYNDEYAMLVVSALRDAGVRVPEDVAVVGADDLVIAGLMRPRLTSVHVDPTTTPGELITMIDEIIRGERAAGPWAVLSRYEPRLVVRETT